MLLAARARHQTSRKTTGSAFGHHCRHVRTRGSLLDTCCVLVQDDSALLSLRATAFSPPSVILYARTCRTCQHTSFCSRYSDQTPRAYGSTRFAFARFADARAAAYIAVCRAFYLQTPVIFLSSKPSQRTNNGFRNGQRHVRLYRTFCGRRRMLCPRFTIQLPQMPPARARLCALRARIDCMLVARWMPLYACSNSCAHLFILLPKTLLPLCRFVQRVAGPVLQRISCAVGFAA